MIELPKWKIVDDQLKPVLINSLGEEIEAAWHWQEGAQHKYIHCPLKEVLFSGGRGTGKTDCLLMDFLQHVGQGYGREWNGVIFRRSFPELEDVINKSQSLYSRIFPTAVYNKQQHMWTFPKGETLKFRHFYKPSDYWQYHGSSFTFIGWDEVSIYPDPHCYLSMFSTLRSKVKGIPLKIRATTNPYGPGCQWLRKRFKITDHTKVVGRIVQDEPSPLNPKPHRRVAIFSHISENKVLLHSQPDYLANVQEAARNDAQLKAWTEGVWGLHASGMFSNVWNPEYHEIPDFPLDLIPPGWLIDRSYDDGNSSPFSVGWHAESDGTPIYWQEHTPEGMIDHVFGEIKGDIIRIGEWYGCGREPNSGLYLLTRDIAQGILDREKDMGIAHRVKPGPADTSIWNKQKGYNTVASDFASSGVTWTKSYKAREHGWKIFCDYLAGSIPRNGRRERPGYFITSKCEKTLELLPVTPRDDKKPDDVDTNSEDHIQDEIRYRLTTKRNVVKRETF